MVRQLLVPHFSPAAKVRENTLKIKELQVALEFLADLSSFCPTLTPFRA